MINEFIFCLFWTDELSGPYSSSAAAAAAAARLIHYGFSSTELSLESFCREKQSVSNLFSWTGVTLCVSFSNVWVEARVEGRISFPTCFRLKRTTPPPPHRRTPLSAHPSLCPSARPVTCGCRHSDDVDDAATEFDETPLPSPPRPPDLLP